MLQLKSVDPVVPYVDACAMVDFAAIVQRRWEALDDDQRAYWSTRLHHVEAQLGTFLASVPVGKPNLMVLDLSVEQVFTREACEAAGRTAHAWRRFLNRCERFEVKWETYISLRSVRDVVIKTEEEWTRQVGVGHLIVEMIQNVLRPYNLYLGMHL